MARRRDFSRDESVGRRSEPRHLRLSRQDSVSRKTKSAPDPALQLPEDLGAVSSWRNLLLHEERRLAKPERLLHSERRERHSRNVSRSEQVLRRRHVGPERVLAFERRQVSRVRHFAGWFGLGDVERDGSWTTHETQ